MFCWFVLPGLVALVVAICIVFRLLLCWGIVLCFWMFVFDCDFGCEFVNSVGIFYLFFNVGLYRFMCFIAGLLTCAVVCVCYLLFGGSAVG